MSSTDYQHQTFVTLAEAARHYRVHPDTVRSWIREGCPHLPAGHQYRLTLDDIAQWLRDRGPVRRRSAATRQGA